MTLKKCWNAISNSPLSQIVGTVRPWELYWIWNFCLCTFFCALFSPLAAVLGKQPPYSSCAGFWSSWTLTPFGTLFDQYSASQTPRLISQSTTASRHRVFFSFFISIPDACFMCFLLFLFTLLIKFSSFASKKTVYSAELKDIYPFWWMTRDSVVPFFFVFFYRMQYFCVSDQCGTYCRLLTWYWSYLFAGSLGG